MRDKTIINTTEIESIFKDYCVEAKIKFSKVEFGEFLKFLETDFYDWVRQNVKYFYTQK